MTIFEPWKMTLQRRAGSQAKASLQGQIAESPEGLEKEIEELKGHLVSNPWLAFTPKVSGTALKMGSKQEEHDGH